MAELKALNSFSNISSASITTNDELIAWNYDDVTGHVKNIAFSELLIYISSNISSVSLSSLEDISNNTILGNKSGSTVAPSALSVSDVRTLLGLATGDSPTFSGLTIGFLSGLLKASSGVVSIATKANVRSLLGLDIPMVIHRNYLTAASWLSSTSAADNNWISVCWSPELGLFCAVAITGTGNRVMTSPDGITWTSRTSAADNNWYSVCWSPELGLFCAVAYSGTGNRVMTSISAWGMAYRTS